MRVADHVQKNAEPRYVVRRFRPGEMARAEEVPVVIGFFAVILAVEQDDVDPDLRTLGVEMRGQFEEHGDAAGGIVGPDDRLVTLLGVLIPLGARAGVPVGAEEDACGSAGLNEAMMFVSRSFSPSYPLTVNSWSRTSSALARRVAAR